MLARSNLRRIAFLVAAASCAFGAMGCVVDNQPSYGYGGGSGGGSGGSAGTSSGGASATPLLVDVDPGRTLNAQPGQGVGVFTEYVSGGHWHVWWTCDTGKTGSPCSFDVKVSVDRDSILDVSADTSTSAASSVTQPTAQSLESQTTTSTGVDGVHFDTTPGAIITLDASVDGMHDGSFLFFVQDGQVNGGYQGTVTDPLMLEGKTP